MATQLISLAHPLPSSPLLNSSALQYLAPPPPSPPIPNSSALLSLAPPPLFNTPQPFSSPTSCPLCVVPWPIYRPILYSIAVSLCNTARQKLRLGTFDHPLPAGSSRTRKQSSPDLPARQLFVPSTACFRGRRLGTTSSPTAQTCCPRRLERPREAKAHTWWRCRGSRTTALRPKTPTSCTRGCKIGACQTLSAATAAISRLTPTQRQSRSTLAEIRRAASRFRSIRLQTSYTTPPQVPQKLVALIARKTSCARGSAHHSQSAVFASHGGPLCKCMPIRGVLRLSHVYMRASASTSLFKMLYLRKLLMHT
jgi:hypothetical protein